MSTYLAVATDMISKAKDNMPTGSICPNIQHQKAADCADLLNMGHNKSGLYEIWPMSRIPEKTPFNVYCDMETNGGGWTVIQRRGEFKTPKDYFYRNWENYKKGFGNIAEDFWIGNDKIFALTNQKPYSVRFDLRAVDKAKRFALYNEFWIEDESRDYTLHIDLYSGDAGDAMKNHNNRTFATFDQGIEKACAEKHKGAWWYRSCSHYANLNGLYYKGKHGNTNADGLSWDPFKGDHESLEWTEIKIRPKEFRAEFS